MSHDAAHQSVTVPEKRERVIEREREKEKERKRKKEGKRKIK